MPSDSESSRHPQEDQDKIQGARIPRKLHAHIHPSKKHLRELSKLHECHQMFKGDAIALENEFNDADHLAFVVTGKIPYNPSLELPRGMRSIRRSVVGACFAVMKDCERGKWKDMRVCDIRGIHADHTMDRDEIRDWTLDHLKSLQDEYAWDILRVLIPCEETNQEHFFWKHGFDQNRYYPNRHAYSMIWGANLKRPTTGMPSEQ